MILVPLAAAQPVACSRAEIGIWAVAGIKIQTVRVTEMNVVVLETRKIIWWSPCSQHCHGPPSTPPHLPQISKNLRKLKTSTSWTVSLLCLIHRLEQMVIFQPIICIAGLLSSRARWWWWWWREPCVRPTGRQMCGGGVMLGCDGGDSTSSSLSSVQLSHYRGVCQYQDRDTSHINLVTGDPPSY